MGVPIKALFAAVIFVITLSFYSPAFAEDVPEDFEVVLVSAPVLQRIPLDVETLTLRADGSATLSPKIGYQGTFPDISRVELPETTILLSPQAMADIYQTIIDENFFELKAVYNDENILDGDYAILRVTANGRTHETLSRNIKVKAFDRIAVKINDYLPEDRRLLYNAINGADYEEVER